MGLWNREEEEEDVKYYENKTKLTKIYSEGQSEASTSTSISVKVEEPTFYSSSNVEYDECIQSEEFTEYDAEIPDSDQCDIETYYTNYRGFRQWNFTPTNFQRRNHQPRSSNANPQLKTEYTKRINLTTLAKWIPWQDRKTNKMRNMPKHISLGSPLSRKETRPQYTACWKYNCLTPVYRKTVRTENTSSWDMEFGSFRLRC